MSISISDFVNFTVQLPGAALPAYNVNSLTLFTRDTPVSGNSVYGYGASATATETAGTINPSTGIALVSGGTGYLTAPIVTLIGGGSGANFKAATVTAQVAGGAVTGFTVVDGGSGYTSNPTVVISSGFGVFVDPISVGTVFGTSSETYQMAVSVFSQTPNILTGGGQLFIYPMASGMTLTQAINAFATTNYTGGIIYCQGTGTAFSSSDVIAAANTVQALNPPSLLYAPTNLLTDIYSGGMSYTIQSNSCTQTRLMINTNSVVMAQLMSAAYASRLQGTNFNGSNTTITMNLKQLTGITPDPLINQTVANQCNTVGVDYYAYVQGIPEVVSTGGNGYSDNVYNLTWLLGALQVAAFNFLAQTPTKIPQTEAGMTSLKNVVSGVLAQAVNNGFLAPGTWTGTTFGNPASLQANISQFGYYVYSLPVSQQLDAQRQARIAPVLQIAIKYAGAIQSVNGIIYINY